MYGMGARSLIGVALVGTLVPFRRYLSNIFVCILRLQGFPGRQVRFYRQHSQFHQQHCLHHVSCSLSVLWLGRGQVRIQPLLA